jgi:hypothetical protein
MRKRIQEQLFSSLERLPEQSRLLVCGHYVSLLHRSSMMCRKFACVS